MKLAQSRRRALVALAGLASACAAPALALDDKSTVSSVMEIVGVSTDETASKIDYSERPKLVLPPNRDALPEPQTRGDRPGAWPSGGEAVRRRNTERFAHAPNAQPEAKQGLLERALSIGSNSSAPVVDEPNRSLLIEPPPGYRRPTQDLSKIRDTDSKGGSWWNPLTYIGGGGSDNNPGTSPAAKPKNSGGGALSSLMPSFLRGSDKD